MRILTTIFLFALLFFACGKKKEARETGVLYTCSMDPQVVSEKPGNCPICGMALTPVRKSSIENSADLVLSDQQVQLGNIRVDTIGKANIGKDLEFTGVLSVNAAQNSSVNARVKGRLEKLYVKTTGDFITKGAPLYEIYSEELNSAKQEYIVAIQRRHLFDEQSVIDFDELIRGARNKLILWGISPAQIKVLEGGKQAPVRTTFYSPASGYVTSLNITEGEYVMEGGPIMQLADLSTLWAEAQVYSSQLYQIPQNASATVHISAFGMDLQGRVEFSNPEIAADTRINLLRVEVPNDGNKLRPGMAVLVRIRSANTHALALPTDAIIRDANGATVWIQTGYNRYRSKMVRTGLESSGITEITSGLEPGDTVVTNGTYLLHSEFQFKRGMDPMAGHNH